MFWRYVSDVCIRYSVVLSICSVGVLEFLQLRSSPVRLLCFTGCGNPQLHDAALRRYEEVAVCEIYAGIVLRRSSLGDDFPSLGGRRLPMPLLVQRDNAGQVAMAKHDDA